jgi:hypothetical protein
MKEVAQHQTESSKKASTLPMADAKPGVIIVRRCGTNINLT